MVVVDRILVEEAFECQEAHVDTWTFAVDNDC